MIHNVIRCDSMRFDSMRFDSIRFDSIRFDSILLLLPPRHLAAHLRIIPRVCVRQARLALYRSHDRGVRVPHMRDVVHAVQVAVPLAIHHVLQKAAHDVDRLKRQVFGKQGQARRTEIALLDVRQRMPRHSPQQPRHRVLGQLQHRIQQLDHALARYRKIRVLGSASRAQLLLAVKGRADRRGGAHQNQLGNELALELVKRQKRAVALGDGAEAAGQGRSAIGGGGGGGGRRRVRRRDRQLERGNADARVAKVDDAHDLPAARIHEHIVVVQVAVDYLQGGKEEEEEKGMERERERWVYQSVGGMLDGWMDGWICPLSD